MDDVIDGKLPERPLNKIFTNMNSAFNLLNAIYEVYALESKDLHEGTK